MFNFKGLDKLSEVYNELDALIMDFKSADVSYYICPKMYSHSC